LGYIGELHPEIGGQIRIGTDTKSRIGSHRCIRDNTLLKARLTGDWRRTHADVWHRSTFAIYENDQLITTMSMKRKNQPRVPVVVMIQFVKPQSYMYNSLIFWA
jgi:hypothetical protein